VAAVRLMACAPDPAMVFLVSCTRALVLTA
jgi:hypothetical protein